jgi:hypothetical protein
VQLSAFGAPLLTNTSVAVSAPFVRALEVTNSQGVPTGNMLRVEAVRFRAVDQAGNVASRAAPFAVGSIPQGVSVSSTGLQSFRIISPALPTALCPAQPCGPVSQSITISAEASGPAGSFNNPFGTGVFFYWVDGAGVTQLIASSQTPLAEEVGGTRRWTWSVSFSAPGATPQIGAQVFAIGVSSQGDGLRTPVNTNVIIVGG